MAEKEADFEQRVVDFAELHGWLAYTVPDSRRITGSGVGFPDLALVQNRTLLFLELKMLPETNKDGRPTAEQEAWLLALDEVRVVQAGVYRPSDEGAIMNALKRRGR